MATMINNLPSLDAPVGLEDGIWYAVQVEEWNDTGAITIVDGKFDEQRLIETAIRARVNIGLPYRSIETLVWDASRGVFDMTLAE